MKTPKMNLQEHHGYYRYDFTWQRIRCHEPTRVKWNLPPGATAAKHWNEVPKQLRVKVHLMAADMANGTFDYARYFPNGAKRHLFLSLPDNRLTVERLVLDVYEPHVRAGDVQDHTVDGYMREFFGIYILPKLGAIEMKHLRPEYIERFINDLKQATWQQKFPNGKISEEKHPLSVRRQNMIKVRLKQMLRLAVSRKYTDEDLSGVVKFRREKKPDIDPFSLEERSALLAAMEQKWRDYFLFAFETGLRPSEQVALESRHIDWRHDKILIRQQYVKGRLKILKTRESHRDVDMIPTVRDTLLRLTSDRKGLIFPNSVGGYLDLANLRNRVWYPALEKSGVREREIYQCRHSFASIMLDAEEKPTWVAHMLGHTSMKMLWERYGRYIKDRTGNDGSTYLKMIRGER